MDEQDFATEYTNGSSAETARGGISAVKDRVADQASDLKNKISSQANSLGNQLGQRIDNARGKTSARLRNTSERLQHLANYVDEHDARDMSQAVVNSSREVVRKHPGKSLLVGLVVGVLLGRMFMPGSNR